MSVVSSGIDTDLEVCRNEAVSSQCSDYRRSVRPWRKLLSS
jgi:hypothetical protein